MAEGGIPSLSARVILGKNTTTWASAYGDRDVGTGEPATVDTLYTHASISKTVISFAVMMLEERGVLDLDAVIAQAKLEESQPIVTNETATISV